MFLFPHPPPTAISPLSLHDALPIWRGGRSQGSGTGDRGRVARGAGDDRRRRSLAGRRDDRGPPVERSVDRSEEHTSELQSPDHLVCRLLLEKKKKMTLVRTVNDAD